MAEYKVKVVVTEDKPSLAEIEKKISEFRSVFATVASRYYSNKSLNKNHTSETEQERA